LLLRRQNIFLIISVISVVTNAGMTVFTMNTLNGLHDRTRYWIFIVFQWVCFSLQVRPYHRWLRFVTSVNLATVYAAVECVSLIVF
jgi:hypothetical protein